MAVSLAKPVFSCSPHGKMRTCFVASVEFDYRCHARTVRYLFDLVAVFLARWRQQASRLSRPT